MDFKKRIYRLALATVMIFCFYGQALAGYLIYLPFENGEKVYCTQENNDTPSHNGNLAYAYDFTAGGYGEIFEKTLVSPIRGEIVELVRHIPDFELNDGKYSGTGDGQNKGGWGNSLVIRDIATEKYVRLAHIKQFSIPENLYIGSIVEIGQKIGEVGCSGFSGGPHLHIQMQNSANSAKSIKFTFIEGPVRLWDYVKSELKVNSFVLDDESDVSLSHETKNYSASKSSEFDEYEQSSPNYTTGGHGYHARVNSTSKPPWYKWKFTLNKTGYFLIYAKWKCGSTRDKKAEYLLYSSDDPDISTTIRMDQSVCTKDHWHFLVGTTFKKNKVYYIRVTGQSYKKYVHADGLRFIRIW